MMNDMNRSTNRDSGTGWGVACRGDLVTEQALPDSAALDAMSSTQILKLMNAQDRTVAAVVDRATPTIAALADAVSQALRGDGRLLYVGAGTSGRLGALDAAECPPTFDADPERVLGVLAGGEPALRRSVEGAEDDAEAGRAEMRRQAVESADVVVGIAAGGTTPFVWSALQYAAQQGATTALITCVPVRQLERAADDAAQTHKEAGQTWLVEMLTHIIELPVGPEVVTGSTRLKAGTATKLTLNMITTAAFVRQGKVWGNLMVDLRATNQKLWDRALRIVMQYGLVERHHAQQLLEAADGRVKRALVMAHRQVDAAEADRQLEAANHQLRALLGPPPV
jgi:N-acetylmuramic acid 6-phosphate etherase